MWFELYNQDNKPTLEDIKKFVNSELWDSLCTALENTYSISPKVEYSSCSMQKGWNVKYRKSGKSICTLYPMKDYFIALVVIGNKELPDSELIMPSCSQYVQQLFNKASNLPMGRWLMIEVRESCVLDDVLKLTQLRVKPKMLV